MTRSKIATWLEKSTTVLLVVLSAFVPLIMFPATLEPLESAKLYLIVVLVSLSLTALIGSWVIDKAFRVRVHASLGWLFAGLVIAAVSTGFSHAPLTSLVGYGLQQYTSFFMIAACVLLIFVGGNRLRETSVQRSILSGLFLSASVVGVLNGLTIVGILQSAPGFIGSPNALGAYMAFMAVLGSGVYMLSSKHDSEPLIARGMFGFVVDGAIALTLVSALFVLLALDVWFLWAAVCLGIGSFLGLAFARPGEFTSISRFALPMLMAVLSVVFLFSPGVFQNTFRAEVIPSYRSTLEVAKASLDWPAFIVGTGPGTFSLNWDAHHPLVVNASSLWDTRFDRGGSHVLTLLATLGPLFLLVIVGFCVHLAWAVAGMLYKRMSDDEWKMTYLFFVPWLLLLFLHVVYSSNVTLTFLLALTSAILVSQIPVEERNIAFSKTPRLALASAMSLIVLGVLIVSGVVIGTSGMAAEVAFAKAIHAQQNGESLDSVILSLDKAARLNKRVDVYYRNLSYALLLKASEELDSPTRSDERVAQFISLSIDAAQEAVKRSPQNALNWRTLAAVYEEIIPVDGSADMLAIDAYKTAIRYSAVNPKHYVDVGRVQLVRAEKIRALQAEADEALLAETNALIEASLSDAQWHLEKAVELKPTYASAYYYLAFAYELQGNLAGAIERLETAKAVSPKDATVRFQLGLFYLRQGRLDPAGRELEVAVALSPEYSNARWYLASVYEQLGRFDDALGQLEIVKALNPTLAIVDERIKEVQSGTVPTVVPPPIEAEETPIAEDLQEAINE